MRQLCLQNATPLMSALLNDLQTQEDSICRRIAFMDKALEMVHETQRKVSEALDEALDILAGN